MPGNIHEEIDPLSMAMLTQEEETGADGGAPLVPTPSKAMLRCYGCSEFGNAKIKRCGACQSAYFCSVNCQKEGWALHKQECGAIRSHMMEEREEHDRNLELAAKLMTTEGPSNNFTCSVCLDEKEEEHRNTVTLPCGHHFCYDCINEVQYSAYDKGFSSADGTCIGLCPECRQPMPNLEILVVKRVQALLTLARTQANEQERDQAYAVALKLVDFVLDKTPAKFLLQEFRGDVCGAMEQHDQAVIHYKKALTLMIKLYQTSNQTGFATRDEYEERMRFFREFETKDPGIELPDNVSDLEKELDSLFAIDGDLVTGVSKILISLSRAMSRCEGEEEKVRALQLSLLVQKINKAEAAQYGGCRQVDTACTMALAECCLAAGRVDHAKKFLRKATRKFRYLSGYHGILAECEKHEGHLEKALFCAAKGYFYEETWNEKGTRAKNLQLWNDIRNSLLQQAETTGN